MSSPRILIVGGVAAGASAATRARRTNEHAEIVIFERGLYPSFANCGLPYHIGGQIEDRSKLLISTPEKFKNMFNIDVRVKHDVTHVDRKTKQIEVVNLETNEKSTEHYDKLILAPGAAPIVPPWDGTDCENVFTLRDVPDMDKIKSLVDEGKVKKAVVIGAGYIGLEMVEAFSERELKVTLVEKLPQVLPLLDVEMSRRLADVLISKGVELQLNATVENLIKEGNKVKSVRLADGQELSTDLVLISIGVRQETKLASDAGLKIGSSGAIAVNEYMQTNDPDIYAAGDAAEVIHAVTGKPMNIPLAGPANRNGRLAGQHAATGSAASATPVAGTAAVGFFGTTSACTGLTARMAEEANIPYEVSYALREHHAGYYPGAEQMVLKLVYNPQDGRVLGAQAVGGAGVDKRIDVIATVIHFKGTVDDLAGLDLAYAPQYGSAKDPVHIAAFVARNQMDGLLQQIPPGGQPKGVLVDVRPSADHAAGSLMGAKNIPLAQLRQRMSELDKDKPVTVHCLLGQTSYLAARILMQSGFDNVWNLAGGYTLNKPGEYYDVDQYSV